MHKIVIQIYLIIRFYFLNFNDNSQLFKVINHSRITNRSLINCLEPTKKYSRVHQEFRETKETLK